jgi:phage terminase small subunit
MPKAKIQKLTAKQKEAADHFLIHGNQSEAFRHAYNVKATTKAETVRSNASALFSKPHVAAYVEKHRNRETNKAIITRERALEILSEIAEGKISEFITESGDIDTVAVAKSGHTVESFRQAITDSGSTKSIKVRDPISAIDRIAKLEGWDKQKESPVDGINFTFVIPKTD